MNNRKAIFLTFIIILGMVVVPTIYKIYKNHNDNLLLVVEKEFMYQAKKCFNEDKCSNIVTLKDLYDNDYLEDKLTNPINKKFYDESSSINVETEEMNLID